MIAWFRRWWRARRDRLAPPVVPPLPLIVDDPAHTASRDELKQRTHDAASRLHVLEWQADVASRRYQKEKPE